MPLNKSNEFIEFFKNASSNYVNINGQNKLSREFGYLIGKINLFGMLFGIFGNLVCVGVFASNKMLKTRFNWYLFVLSLVDAWFCIIIFLNYLINIFNKEKTIKDLNKLSCYFHDYILNLLDTYCVYIAFILSIDRLYAIKKPIGIKNFFTHKYPKCVVIIGFLIISIASLPIVFLNPRAYVTPSFLKHASNFESNIDNNNYEYINIENVNQVKNAIEDSSSKKALLNELKFDYLLKPSSKKFDIYVSSNDLQPFCMFITIYDIDHIFNNYNKQEIEIYYHIFFIISFNFLPALLVVIFNFCLVYFIIQYSRINSSAFSINGLRRHSGTQRVLENRHLKKNFILKNTYHMTILGLGFYLLISNIPYYIFTIWEWIMHLETSGFFKSNLSIRLQAISSVLFNSNHYIYLIVYTIFHKTFRFNLKVLLVKLLLKLNLNSILKCDSSYIDANLSKIMNPNNGSRSLMDNFEMGAVANVTFNGDDNQKEHKINTEYESIVFIDEYSDEAFTETSL